MPSIIEINRTQSVELILSQSSEAPCYNPNIPTSLGEITNIYYLIDNNLKGFFQAPC